MDQGFAPQGFSGQPSASTVDAAGKAARDAIEKARGHKPSVATSGETAAKGAASSAGKYHPTYSTADPTRKHIADLEGVHSTFMLPAQFELVGMLGGGALGWVTNKFGWKQVTAGLGMAFKAPLHALRHSSIAEFFRIPANFFKAASTEAASGGDATTGWVDASTRRAQALTSSAERVEGRVASFFASPIKAVGNGITWFESTALGKSFLGGINSFIDNRKAAAFSRHEAQFIEAQKALTTQAAVGWKGSIRHFFSHKVMRNEAATVDVGELSSIMHGLEGAKGDHHAMKSLVGQLETLVADGSLSAEATARAGNAMKHVGKLVGSAHAIETYGNTAGGSMKTAVKAFAKAAGRIPVFNALLGVGIAAGVTATALTYKAESKEATAAMDGLSARLADSDSGLVDAITNAQKSQGFFDVAKTGMKLVGVVADGAMWMLPGGGGMAMMTAMMLPQFCESLVPGNPSLGGLVALQKHDAGEIKLDRDAKVLAIRNLVAVMPAVAAKGGFYNHLAQPIAAEIAQRNLTSQQIEQLLGNNAAFTQLSREVADTLAQKSAEKAKATVANGNDGPHPAAEKAQAAMSSKEAAYHAAAKPMSMVAANDVQLDGKAAGTHLQVS